jgi:hypothetical protein
MKRGELSMEVIIIAAIALLVLVIISFLVIRSGTGVAQGTSCTAVSGGQCQSESCGDGYIRSANSCPNTGEFCCVPLQTQS